MVTLRVDFCRFALGKPNAKQHKSIPLVTIVLLIGSPWQILHVQVFSNEANDINYDDDDMCKHVTAIILCHLP